MPPERCIDHEYEIASVERVTVTLPDELVRDIDRREKNRSKFVAEAVRVNSSAATVTTFGFRFRIPIPKAPN